MTGITLFDGCYVKTAEGEIAGPLSPWNSEKLSCLLCQWTMDGRGYDPSGDYGMGYFDSAFDVVAAYPTLAAAAVANPEM